MLLTILLIRSIACVVSNALNILWRRLTIQQYTWHVIWVIIGGIAVIFNIYRIRKGF